MAPPVDMVAARYPRRRRRCSFCRAAFMPYILGSMCTAWRSIFVCPSVCDRPSLFLGFAPPVPPCWTGYPNGEPNENMSRRLYAAVHVPQYLARLWRSWPMGVIPSTSLPIEPGFPGCARGTACVCVAMRRRRQLCTHSPHAPSSHMARRFTQKAWPAFVLQILRAWPDHVLYVRGVSVSRVVAVCFRSRRRGVAIVRGFP